ncbi:BMP family lipoprotein [Demequina oxidasica]|uniref:BMP family lipoprotein n=1 Tax=Demequina oxidasica TaxID=676199 RepID=UPI000780C40A|nr:BMP family ABC transporter substrate-binding protein [Demequina oxidasica]
MKNAIRIGAVVAASALALAACSSAPEETTSPESTGAATSETSESAMASVDYKACMVSDAGGFDDNSFNESGYDGLTQAETELGIEINTAESADENDFGPNIDAMVADGCDMIITVGFLLGDATAAAAVANPDVNFALIDSTVDPEAPNVKPILFETDQAAFLAGYVAAGTSETGSIGTYGGINIPPVSIFMNGLLAGANYFNSETDGDVKVLGWDGENGSFVDNFDDAPKSQTIAEGMLDQGADIIMPVAGPIGGAAEVAITDNGSGWFIGVDKDWTQSTPEYSDIILTSVLKNIGNAVFDVISAAAVDGTFDSTPYLGTLENEGVGLAELNAAVPADVAGAVDGLKAGIIDGSISVAVS